MTWHVLVVAVVCFVAGIAICRRIPPMPSASPGCRHVRTQWYRMRSPDSGIRRNPTDTATPEVGGIMNFIEACADCGAPLQWASHRPRRPTVRQGWARRDATIWPI